MKVKNFTILISTTLALVLMIFIPQGAAEMWVMSEEELDQETVTTQISADLIPEARPESEGKTDTGELLEQTEEQKFDEYLREKSLPPIDQRINKAPIVYVSEQFKNNNSIWSGREITTQFSGPNWGSGFEYKTRDTDVFPSSNGPAQ
jgi:hypothetical protein